MVFSFILNDWELLAFLQSLGNEFQTMAPQYAHQFCPSFVFNRGLNIDDFFQELQYNFHSVHVRIMLLGTNLILGNLT